ncbi:D-alanyl-D-alanine carboxypeptidase family protein [Micromonospora chokoriensis]
MDDYEAETTVGSRRPVRYRPRHTPITGASRLLAMVLTAMLLLAGAVSIQMTRPLPTPQLRSSLPPSVTVPGELRGVPWPTVGQARVDVVGLGTLGESGIGQPVPIGSVAKVMTAYVVLVDRPLDSIEPGPNIDVTAADVNDYHRRIPGGESLVEVAEGQSLTQRQALEALLLPSANNVAIMLAKWNAGGIDAFVTKMNATAERLGMTGSRYTDPSGLDPTTVSTAADQALLARAAMELPALAQIVAQKRASIPVAGSVRNYNDLLGDDGVVGIKTGSTDEAGGNLAFAARIKVGERTLMVVGAVLGQPGRDTPEQLRAVNIVVRGLLAAARKLVRAHVILPAGVVGYWETHRGVSVNARITSPVTIVGWPGLSVKLDLRPAAEHVSARGARSPATLLIWVGDDVTSVEVTTDDVAAPWWWRLAHVVRAAFSR